MSSSCSKVELIRGLSPSDLFDLVKHTRTKRGQFWACLCLDYYQMSLKRFLLRVRSEANKSFCFWRSFCLMLIGEPLRRVCEGENKITI